MQVYNPHSVNAIYIFLICVIMVLKYYVDYREWECRVYFDYGE